ncbi:hypothetical protein F8388_019062 [Cannabis sativa]|uniref:Uncharacterized protein n=1 Tax=Cannabis sativa TaxID=3483 RepID=A0A7J6FCI0_CANSA|nr:hypothetical protein F8388_019062 [Cannabis sativa]
MCSYIKSKVNPLLTRFSYCVYPNKPQALIVQNKATGIPNSSPALTVNDIAASETTQLTGGSTEVVSFSLRRSFLKGSRQFFSVDSHRAGMSWVASALLSVGGMPSGMDSNRKPGKPSRELGPLDLRRRSLASFIRGVMWPCAGYGMNTA